MSENRSGRHPDNAAQGMAKATSESQLRRAAEDASSVFPDDVPPTDEAPTIISKNPPAQAVTTTAIKPVTPEMLLGSLRGRKLAHFELIEPIGVGGMAAVLRARDTQLDRNVALKILPPDMAHDTENIARFRQEARAAAKLDHENIARVFFCGEDQKLNFIAFEFVEGENLRTILDRRRRLPVPEAVRYVLQIATGLEHAEARGVVHRDVKPSNIIITPNGRAKLVDMGLARSLEPQTNQLTQSGMTLGTFDYISPEQALEPREADCRSDIYSLGCTLYHMLTGQPPVPEGTAAKKMHHHQHVAPIDPRQLNPEIPDEVVLVLSRMMAKNPKDRYQRPIQLVQHLMQLAHKVGAAADLPEGVMFVDTPLLAPPRKRPLLLIAGGALALAALLMVLSVLQTPHKPSGKGAPGTKDEVKVVKDGPNAPTKLPPGASAPALPKGVREIRKEEDLAALLQDDSPTLVGLVVQSFEIADGNLVFHGNGNRSLTLKPKADDESEGSQRRTISWKWQPRETGEPAAALTIDDGDAVFTDLRFRIDGSAGTPEDQSAGVIAVRGKGDIRFEKCSFQQMDVASLQFTKNRDRVPLASVLVLPGGKGERPPRLDLHECLFSYGSAVTGGNLESGQAAIGLHGPADVNARNCSFMPHAAQFHQRGAGLSKITLINCSAFVVTGPVFRLDDDTSCLLKIDNSILSSPESVVSTHDPLHLIHQTDAAEPKVTFLEWKRNCYDHLNGMWVRRQANGGETYIATYEEFKREIANYGGKDNNSTTVPDGVSIWANDKPHRQQPKVAFQLSKTAREVRDGALALGIQRDLWGPMPSLPPLPDEPRLADLKDNEKVVDPSYKGKQPGIYTEVGQAVYAANNGDVIRIKHAEDNRRLNVEVTQLKKKGVDVTLRPYDDKYHPILTLAPTVEPNAYFFRLHDGKMTFEHLEIELEPDQTGFLSQTLALMDANASCTFKNCIITLKPNAAINPNRTVPLSVVTLSEIDEAMMAMGAKPARAAPEVIFENCFIRGDGEVVTNLAGRPLDLQLNNTLVGVAGSFLTVQAGPKESIGALVKLNLQKSSVFTTEPMLVLKQGKNRHPKGLPPVNVDRAGNCLFGALEEKPLVSTEFPGVSDDNLHSFFDWKGAGDNFSGYERLLEDFSGFQLDQNRWQATFYKGAIAQFVRVTLPLPQSSRKLWEVGADDFRPKAESLQRHGATFDNDQIQLPPIERKGKSE